MAYFKIVLSIFRTNQLLFTLLILPYLFLIRISSFTEPLVGMDEGSGIFSKFVYQVLPLNNIYSHIGALILIFFQSLIVNIICSRFKIFDEPNQLCGLFYAMLCSIFPEFLWLSPVLMANTFLLFALFELFEIYDKKAGAGSIFNIGFFIGIASLFYFPAIILLIFALIGLGIQRTFSIKEAFMILIGAFVPFYLLFTYFYWNDSLEYFRKMQFENGVKFLQPEFQFKNNSFIEIIIVCLMIFVFLFNINRLGIKRNIQVIKIQKLLYWWILIIPFGLMIGGKIHIDYLLMFMLPSSFLLTYVFLGMKKQWADALHLIIITFIIVFQYIKYLL